MNAMPSSPRELPCIVADYAEHTEYEKLVCVLAEITSYGRNRITFDVSTTYFTSPLEMSFGPIDSYDVCRFTASVDDIYENDPDNVLDCLEPLGRILPSRKKLFGHWQMGEDLRKNIRNTYRIKMSELMSRY